MPGTADLGFSSYDDLSSQPRRRRLAALDWEGQGPLSDALRQDFLIPPALPDYPAGWSRKGQRKQSGAFWDFAGSGWTSGNLVLARTPAVLLPMLSTVPGLPCYAETWRALTSEPMPLLTSVDSWLSLTQFGFPVFYNAFVGASCGFWVQAFSKSGTPAYTVTALQSPLDADPSTPWVPSTLYAPINTPSNGIIYTGSDGAIHTDSWTPIRMPFVRFRVTGTGSNPADTLLTLYISLTR